MKLEARKKEDRGYCSECDWPGMPLFHIEYASSIGDDCYLCIPCLQLLRSKIDALSVLVQTGIETKEKQCR